MTPIKSSSISGTDYDPASQRLRVQFASGAIYTYDKVPAEVHQGLLAAESAGRYFQQAIRGQFAGAREESAGE